MAVYPLSGFVDEISPDLHEQLAVAKKLGLTGVDIRSVDGINVLDLDDDKLSAIRNAAREAGLSVIAVGSPVNKVPFSAENRAIELGRMRKAIHAARLLGAKRIRIFSPEVPEAEHESKWPEVEAWMKDQIDLATHGNVLLVHENDARYYGAYPENAKRLMESLHGPHFRFAFDFANTVQLGFSPVGDWLGWVLPYTDTIHIKDAKRDTKQVVPAGQGDGEIEPFLKAAFAHGWHGTFVMEPHLQHAGHAGGFSGAELFETATDAFRAVLNRLGETAGW